MFALCVESSHEKGMGHLFRTLVFQNYLDSRNMPSIICINDHRQSLEIIKNIRKMYEVVDYSDIKSKWELDIIKKYKIKYWWNDRLDTCLEHSSNIKSMVQCLINLDDFGSGAFDSDLNFFGLSFKFDEKMKGKKILFGSKYLILNKEINFYKKLRSGMAKKILVALGGSDTFGVTLKIVKVLKARRIHADILIGPGFEHKYELEKLCEDKYKIFQNVSSIFEFFNNYDLAITGGGITPFEANALGLPCIIIASEIHEIKNGQYLNSLGSSVFWGYHQTVDYETIKLDFNLGDMSRMGVESLDTNACERIYSELSILNSNINL